MPKRKARQTASTVMTEMKAVIDDGRVAAAMVDDNLLEWNIEFPGALFVERHVELFLDLEKYGGQLNRKASIMLHVTFPRDYPHEPPFARVVQPFFQFHTGHVTVGGSICTEHLTRQSWSSDTTITELMMMLQELLIQGKARVDFGSAHHPDYTQQYTFDEARYAFTRVATDHGWRV